MNGTTGHDEVGYTNLLLASRHFSTVPINETTANSAADLRARQNLSTPAPIQIAAAREHGCDAFLTNDVALAGVIELCVLILD